MGKHIQLLALLTAVLTILESCTPTSKLSPLPATPTFPNFLTSTTQTINQKSSGLPQSLYFLSKMDSDFDRIWKLETDATTLTQIKLDPGEIVSFDVSPISGNLAFSIGSALLMTEGDKSIPIFEGTRGQCSSDGNISADLVGCESINSVYWSPDGKNLAFSSGGVLYLYKLSTMKYTQVLPDQVNSKNIPGTIYQPYSWSPDSQKILVEMDLPVQGSTLGVYSLASQQIVWLKAPDDDLVCCQASWSVNSELIFVSNFYLTVDSPTGLWQFIAANGIGTTLVPSIDSDSTYNFAGWPFLTPDNQLLYFFANSPSLPEDQIPLSMVASPEDNLGDRRIIRSEAVMPQEVLWARDGSLAIIVQAGPGATQWMRGGPVILMRINNSPAIPLVSEGFQLRWGP